MPSDARSMDDGPPRSRGHRRRIRFDPGAARRHLSRAMAGPQVLPKQFLALRGHIELLFRLQAGWIEPSRSAL